MNGQLWGFILCLIVAIPTFILVSLGLMGLFHVVVGIGSGILQLKKEAPAKVGLQNVRQDKAAQTFNRNSDGSGDSND